MLPSQTAMTAPDPAIFPAISILSNAIFGIIPNLIREHYYSAHINLDRFALID